MTRGGTYLDDIPKDGWDWWRAGRQKESRRRFVAIRVGACWGVSDLTATTAAASLVSSQRTLREARAAAAHLNRESRA